MKSARKHNEDTAWTDVAGGGYPTLAESLETDVCIIGAGLAGLLAAYRLSEAGFRVAVIDKGRVALGTTEHTTAFLTASIDTDFSDLIRSFGPEDAKLIVDSHMKSIAEIERIAKKESVECDFMRCSDFIYATEKKYATALDEERDAATELGLEAILEKDGRALAFHNEGYIEIKDQAKFHPLKFAFGIAEALTRQGVKIFEKTEAEKIEKRDFGHAVKANGHSIQAKWVICATYRPFNEPLRLYFKKGMYRTYVIEAKTEWKLPEAIYEDTENPYHYLRVDKVGTGYRLILGGEDRHDDLPMDDETNFEALESYLASLLPHESYEIVRKWTGPILEPVDGLAFIGPKSRKGTVMHSFGFSGNGMTYSGIAAMLLSDLIRAIPNPWYELYRADRMPHLRALATKGKDHAEELLGGAVKNTIESSKKSLKDVLPKRREGPEGNWKSGSIDA